MYPTPLLLFHGKHDEYKIFITKGWVPFFPSSECRNLFVPYLSVVVNLFFSFPNILNLNTAHFHVVYLLLIKKVCEGLYSFLPFHIILLIKPRESPRHRYSQCIVDRLWFSQTKSKGGQGHFAATRLNAKTSLVQNTVRISFSFFYSSAFGSVWGFLEKRMWCVVQNVQPLEANTRTVWFMYIKWVGEELGWKGHRFYGQPQQKFLEVSTTSSGSHYS